MSSGTNNTCYTIRPELLRQSIMRATVPTVVGILSYQLDLKMREELANLNRGAVPFLSRVAVNLSWYDYNYNLFSRG